MLRSMLFPLSWKEAAGGAGSPGIPRRRRRGQVPRGALGTGGSRRAQGPGTAAGDTHGGQVPLRGAREGAPGRMDGAGKAGNAGRGGGSAGGQEAGPGQESSHGSGLGGKAEEERRKGSRPPRWRREEAWPRPGAAPVHVVPAGRGWDSAVPAAGPKLARSRQSLRLQTPLVGLQVPACPGSATPRDSQPRGRSQKRGTKPLGHPFGGRGGGAATQGVPGWGLSKDPAL